MELAKAGSLSISTFCVGTFSFTHLAIRSSKAHGYHLREFRTAYWLHGIGIQDQQETWSSLRIKYNTNQHTIIFINYVVCTSGWARNKERFAGIAVRLRPAGIHLLIVQILWDCLWTVSILRSDTMIHIYAHSLPLSQCNSTSCLQCWHRQ